MKLFYGSVLFSTLLLTGCSDEKVSIETPVASAEVMAPLTAAEKQQLYKAYGEIVARINAENGTSIALDSIIRMKQWVSEEQFEAQVVARLAASYTVAQAEPQHPMAAQKTVTYHIGEVDVPIVFTAAFDTQLNENTPAGRQLFDAFHDVLSTGEHWEQLAYEAKRINGETYHLFVSGTYRADGIISQHLVNVPYYVTETGGVY